MIGQYHDHGYDLALDCVIERASRKPGKQPVVSPVGRLITITDIDTFGDLRRRSLT